MPVEHGVQIFGTSYLVVLQNSKIAFMSFKKYEKKSGCSQ
jgi:hypothetical protein